MAELPLVTVVVPAYNSEDTLTETLACALAQTYPHVEIIVVDDGSTDRTAAIALSFAARSPAISLIRTANRGVGAARNTGVAAARGDWIAPFDADDLWHPAKLARQVDVALHSPHRPAFVYCWARLIDMAGQVTGEQEPREIRGRVLHQLLYRNFIGCGGSLLISRAAMREFGGYGEDLALGEDVLIQLEMALRHTVDLAPAYLVGYRTRPGSMSSDSDKVWRGWRRFAEQVAARCPDAPACLDRWRRARTSAQRAAGDLLAGRRLDGLRRLAGALWLDPAWTSAWLLDRLGRRRRRAGPAPQPPHFSQADPDAIGLGGGAEPYIPLFLRIEARRMRRLAALDGG